MRDLADAVRTGRYSPDERLPTLVSLAVANDVHPRTMSRALRRLRELGYVTYRQGYGYFVSHPRLRIVGPVPWRSARRLRSRKLR